jgi:hypothetical protein
MNRYDEDYHPHDSIELPCGSYATWDEGSGIAYRCDWCGAIVGSIGQPTECVEKAKRWEANKILGGQSWEEHLAEKNKDIRIKTE